MSLYSKLLIPFYVLVGAIVFAICLRLLDAVTAEDIDLLSSFLGRTFFPGDLLRKVFGVDRSARD